MMDISKIMVNWLKENKSQCALPCDKEDSPKDERMECSDIQNISNQPQFNESVLGLISLSDKNESAENDTTEQLLSLTTILYNHIFTHGELQHLKLVHVKSIVKLLHLWFEQFDTSLRITGDPSTDRSLIQNATQFIETLIRANSTTIELNQDKSLISDLHKLHQSLDSLGSIEPEHLLLGSSTNITSLFSDCTGSLFSGNEAGQIVWWNFKTNRPWTEWQAHNRSVLSIAFVQSISAYLSQGRDGLIKFWQLDHQSHTHSQVLSSLITSELTFCRLSLWHNADSSFLCHLVQDKSAGNDKLEVVHFPSHTISYQLEAILPEKIGMCMVLQGWSHFVLACYESGHLILFDLHESSSTRNHQIIAKQIADTTIMAMSFCPSTGRGVIGTADSDHLSLFTIDIGSTYEISIIKRVNLTNPGIGSAVWRKDGRLFATGGWDGRVRVFSNRSCKLLAVLDWSHAVCLDGDGVAGLKSDSVKSVQCVLFTKDDYLVSAGGDKSICVWNVYRNS